MIVRELLTKWGVKVDDKQLKNLNTRLKSTKDRFNEISKSATKIGKSLSLKLTLPLVAGGFLAVRAFDKQAKAIEQVRIGIESTGGAAGKTLDELLKMATRLQRETLFGDEEILGGATAQLLTFTNIAGQQFDRTQRAILDVATRLGAAKGGSADLTSTAILLGKALNDPVANLGALGRTGIQFSEDQKKLIKSFAQTNRLAEAQNLVLTELEKQYGGSAKAAAAAGTGAFTQLKNDIGDLAEQFGELITEFLNPFIQKIRLAVQWAQTLDKEQKLLILTIAALVAGLGPALIAFGLMVNVFGFAVTGATKLLVILRSLRIASALFAGIWTGAVLSAILIFEDILGFALGKKSFTGFLLDQFSSLLDELDQLFTKLPKSVQVFLAAITFPIRAGINLIQALAGALGALVEGDFRLAGQALLEGLKNTFSNPFAAERFSDLIGFDQGDKFRANADQRNQILNAAAAGAAAPVFQVQNTVNVPPGTPPGLVGEAITKGIRQSMDRTLKESRKVVQPTVAF